VKLKYHLFKIFKILPFDIPFCLKTIFNERMKNDWRNSMNNFKIFFVALLFYTTTFIFPQQYGWQVIYQPPSGGIVSIDFIDSLHGWAFNSLGAGLLRTVDGGLTWIASSTTFGATISDIDFIDHSHGWAIGDNNSNNAIYKTDDSGKIWQPVYFELSQSMPSGQGITLDKVIGVGSERNQLFPDTAIIVKSTDGGESFNINFYTEELGIAKRITFKKILFTDTLHGWIYGWYEDLFGIIHGVFLKTDNGGLSWEKNYLDTLIGKQSPLVFQSFTFIDILKGWAFNGISFYKTENGGMTWDSLFSFNTNPPGFEDIYFIDPLNGWSFGNQFYQGQIKEVIYRTSNGGYNWERESVALSDYAFDGIMLSPYLGYVAGDDAVLKYGLITNVEKLPEIPKKYFLRNNYPNPFNLITTIEYEILKRSSVELIVFNILGKEIQTLVDEVQAAGVYSVKFDGSYLSSGTYFYKLKTDNYEETKQMILLK
jgi:photosystem II stability/assembly factor-like uncharacterized protein